MRKVLLVFFLIGCVSNNGFVSVVDDYALPEKIDYSASSFKGFVKSNTEPCNSSGVTVIVFGLEGDELTSQVLRVVGESNVSVLEFWTPSNWTPKVKSFFKAFNPGMNYPTVIVNCEFVKVGGNGLESLGELLSSIG